jgi:signal transduction histidine kinase
MNKRQKSNGHNDEARSGSMVNRVKDLFAGQELPSYASLREVDAMKARITELEAALALQSKDEVKAQGQATRPEQSLAQPRITKRQAQVTKKYELPRFLRYFSAPVFEGDTEKTRSAKLLYQIIRVIWFLPVLLVTIGILGGRAEVYPPAIVISTCLLILMGITRLGWVKLASAVITMMIVLVFGYADFQNAGNIQPSTLIIAVAIIMSGLLLGKRAPLVVAILMVISHGLIVRFQMQGAIELKSAPAVGIENIVITSIMTLIIGSLFQFVISRLQTALNQARENERELKVSNFELEELSKSLEQNVERRTHDLELASEVGHAITEKVGNLTEMLTNAVETIRSKFDLYYTQIYLVDVSGRSLMLRAGTGEAGVQLLRRGHRLALTANSLNSRAASSRQAVLVDDTQKNANFLPNPLLPLTRSELAVPLVVNNTVVGVLDMQSEGPGTFSESNLPAFQVLAGQLAIAIQNSNLFDAAEAARSAVEEQARRLTSSGWQDFLDAVERSENIGYVFDHNEILPLVNFDHSTTTNTLTLPIQVTGSEVGEIRLTDEANKQWTKDETEIVEAVMSHMAHHLENLRLLAQADRYRNEAELVSRRLTSEGWMEYLRTRTELADGYVYNQNEVKPANGNGNYSSSTLLSYPLVVRDEPIGNLMLDANSGAELQTVELVTAVVEQLTDHIESLRLLEQTEQKRLELETVATVSATASTVLNPDMLLQSVVDLTKERFGLYHAHIYLADESWSTLLLAAGAGEVGRKLVEKEHFISLNAERSLVARAARERTAVIVNDVRSEPDFLPNPLLPETRAEMAVPMVVGDQVLGVFDVQSEIVNGYSKEDAAIYTTLASQVAVALQNARLYVEQAATVAQLRELDRLKSSFLANMSHELRTPLNSILGFTDVMLEGLDGPLTDYMDSDLRLIQKNGQHLLHLINDVLDMAKIESGRMNLHPETFKVHSVLDEVISITSTLAGDKNLSLFIDENSDQAIEVYADNTRLRQVMINLVNNSIKFTDKGRIVISATSVDHARVLISVQDTGIGIPPDKLEAIFQEFTQVDTSTTRKVGGTGLGLPISRRLVEMHGGRLWAESSGIEGEGSTFHVELPIEARITDVIEKQEK